MLMAKRTIGFAEPLSRQRHHHQALSIVSLNRKLQHSPAPASSSVPGGLFESFSFHLLWILVILLFASDPGINQVQSENAPSAAALTKVVPVPGYGGYGYGGSQQQHSSQSSTSTTSSSLINSNNNNSNITATGNFSDLGDSPFENNTFTSTTVPVGDTAFLKCTVRNLGNRTISWIRRRDMHIITVDRIVYTNDERFNILHIDGSDDWVLQIKFVQKRDNGTYECQVSSGKGISSFSVHVFVVVPEAFILGNGEYHIQQGSTINLVCIIEKMPTKPLYIFWFHNDRMINYGSTRDLSIQTETGSKTQSRLIIENAQVSDSGNYTCDTPGAEPAHTLVYISQGDKMAAIQRRKSDGVGGGGSGSGGSSGSATSVAASSSSVSSSSSPTLLRFKGSMVVMLTSFICLLCYHVASSSSSSLSSSSPASTRQTQNALVSYSAIAAATHHHEHKHQPQPLLRRRKSFYSS